MGDVELGHVGSDAREGVVKKPVDLSARPGEEGKPTRVYVNLILHKIGSIDSAKGSVFLKMKFNMHWHDPRMVGYTGDPFRLPGELWGPRMDCPLGTSTFVREEERPMSLRNAKTGHLLRTFIWDGDINSSPDLRNFPLDHVDIDVKFTGVSSMSANGEVQIIQNATHVEWCSIADAPEDIRSAFPNEKILNIALWNKKLSEWQFDSLWYSFDKWLAPSGIQYSQMLLKFRVFRKTGFYLTKILFPLNLLFVITMFIFAFDPTDFDSRMNAGTTMFLAVVAFLFVVNGDIPRVGYLTKLDYFIILEMLSQFVLIVVSGILFLGEFDDRTARIINLVSVGVNIVLFLVIEIIILLVGYLQNWRTRRKTSMDRTMPEKVYLSSKMF